MSQKSSFTQPSRFVSQALTPNTMEVLLKRLLDLNTSWRRSNPMIYAPNQEGEPLTMVTNDYL
jgi:hypothetical protein